jgi:hypothetical protein
MHGQQNIKITSPSDFPQACCMYFLFSAKIKQGAAKFNSQPAGTAMLHGVLQHTDNPENSPSHVQA